MRLPIQGQAFDGNPGAHGNTRIFGANRSHGAELDHGAREIASRLDGGARREAAGRNAVAFADQPRVIRPDPRHGNEDGSCGQKYGRGDTDSGRAVIPILLAGTAKYSMSGVRYVNRKKVRKKVSCQPILEMSPCA